MTKNEIKELEFLIKLVEDIETDCEDVLPKDEDGGFIHNSMVVLSKITHIKNQLKNSWQNDKIEIKDWTES